MTDPLTAALQSIASSKQLNADDDMLKAALGERVDTAAPKTGLTEDGKVIEFAQHETQPDKLADATVAELRQKFEVFKSNFDDRELAEHGIRQILDYIRENPMLKDVLMPEDIGALVQKQRDLTGMLIAKKQAAKGKRAANAERRSAMDDKLGDMQFDL